MSALPFTDTVVTTEATTDADDTALNEQCGFPAVDASVWYEVTTTSDVYLAADSSRSDYGVGTIVATGSPGGGWTVVACDPHSLVGWLASAGQAYSVLVFDQQFESGNGGVLNITIGVATPPPSINATVNPTATFNATTGTATVSGTVTCTGVADFAYLEVYLSQNVGRFIVRGFGFTEVTCDGEARDWSVEVFGDNGKFGGGKALSVTIATACNGAWLCGQDFQESTIHLKGGGRR